MTVSNFDDFRADMQGNGVTQDIPIRFYFMLETDLQVLRSTSTSVTPMVLGTDYTVTGAGNLAGGNVHMLVPPSVAQFVTVLPNVPFSQLTHYVEGDPFPAASHENALDRLTQLARQIKEQLDRCIKAPANAAGFNGEIPSLFAGGMMTINTTKTGLDLVVPPSGTGDLVFSAIPVYADNNAALAGGLIAGQTYRTPAGEIRSVVGTVSVTLSPIIQGILTSETATLTATVTGTTDTGLTWAVDGVWNGNATVGTLAGTGLVRVYTPPATPGAHVITATSTANPNASASASVVSTVAAEVAVYLYPTVLGNVFAESETVLTAVVTGSTNTAVVWDVDGTVGGSAAYGTITGTGTTVIYTAPADAGSHVVTATSAADGSKSAAKTIVTVAVSGITLTKTPAGNWSMGATDNLGYATFTSFEIDVNGSAISGVYNEENILKYYVDGIQYGNAAVGLLERTNVGGILGYRDDGTPWVSYKYTSPGVAGTHTIRIESIEDPDVDLEFTMTLSAVTPVTITLDPADATTVEAETTEVFTATMTGVAAGYTTRWFVDNVEEGNATVGALTGTGNSRTYTAPADAGTHTLSVYYSQDLTKRANCQIFVTAAPEATAIPGFGYQTTGGTGQTTVHVTNTNNTGAGSLRASLGSNRIIVFDVGGDFTLATKLTGSGLSNLTIDGTDAPSPGVTLLMYPLQFTSSHNIILKNFRHRAGDYGGGDATGDGGCIVFMPSCYNCVADHMSFSGYTDEAVDFYDATHDFTFKDCIVSVAATGHTSLQAMMGNRSYNGTFYHNLFYLGGYRSPAIGWDTDSTISPNITGEVINNLIWRYISYGITCYLGAKANALGNYLYSTTHPGESGRAMNIESRGSLYSSGNYSKDGSSVAGNAGSPYTVPAAAQITPTSAATAAAYVLANAGCRVGGLDAHDQAIIDSITAVGL